MSHRWRPVSHLGGRRPSNTSLTAERNKWSRNNSVMRASGANHHSAEIVRETSEVDTMIELQPLSATVTTKTTDRSLGGKLCQISMTSNHNDKLLPPGHYSIQEWFRLDPSICQKCRLVLWRKKIERCIELFNSLFSVPKFDNVPISFPSFLNGWHSTSGISSVLGLWHGRECYFFLCSSIILPWSIAAVREKISPLYRVNYCICFVARYLKRLLNLALTPLRWLPDSIGGKLLKKAWNVWEILLFKFYYIIN